MKKINLLPQTILLLVAIISFSFTIKTSIEREKKNQASETVTVTQSTDRLLLIYSPGLTSAEKAQARQCFSSYIGAPIIQAIECDTNENAEILRFAINIEVPPTVGMNAPEDPDAQQTQEGATLNSNLISFDTVMEAIDACPNVSGVSFNYSSCKNFDPSADGR
ncbi:hypothetical protein [Tenacibaculum aiptasiae]|uniref:hypothetical protein n=1 Tax=Tenacibaculum aiptasiae TaxID=426481 RepID=UPI002331546D|nr:hypothetical protein [Tenacibaculum aiptasiae]